MEMSLEQSMRTIIPWINSLPPVDCALFTMDSNMKDGKVIAGIVETITSLQIPDLIRRPKTLEQREHNFNLIINHFIAHCPNFTSQELPEFLKRDDCSKRMADV